MSQHLVRHLTRFTYNAPVRESVMELRMQPLGDRRQRCLRFSVSVAPRARVFAYRDHLGNAVHYFDLPGRHNRLDITAEAAVELVPCEALPEKLPESSWDDIDTATADGAWDDWLMPSRFAADTPTLREFAGAIRLARRDDPLTVLRDLTSTLHKNFAYKPQSTQVDSPIDEALKARAGVCQDFTHIMLALVRRLGVPARYVSGYLVPREGQPRERAENATHAWIEAYMPPLGWVGFDPTNNAIGCERHIAVALGRDYEDVPPARGVFKGEAGSELGVAVSITRPDMPIAAQELVPTITWIAPARPTEQRLSADFLQQQQQQQ